MIARRLLMAHQTPETPSIMSITPMIDIVFLLIIFFLFGDANLREQQVIATLAAAGDALPTASPTATWLAIRLGEGVDDAPEFRVDGGPWQNNVGVVSALLSEALAIQRAEYQGSVQAAETTGPILAVVVDPHEGVSLQTLVEAFALCEAAGATTVSVRTD